MPGWAPSWANGLVDAVIMKAKIQDPLDALNDRLVLTERSVYVRSYANNPITLSTTARTIIPLTNFQENVTGWTINAAGELVVPAGATDRYDLSMNIVYSSLATGIRSVWLAKNSGGVAAGGTIIRTKTVPPTNGGTTTADVNLMGEPLNAGDTLTLTAASSTTGLTVNAGNIVTFLHVKRS